MGYLFTFHFHFDIVKNKSYTMEILSCSNCIFYFSLRTGKNTVKNIILFTLSEACTSGGLMRMCLINDYINFDGLMKKSPWRIYKYVTHYVGEIKDYSVHGGMS